MLAQVNPARAGMILAGLAAPELAEGKPRTRGDDPTVSAVISNALR